MLLLKVSLWKTSHVHWCGVVGSSPAKEVPPCPLVLPVWSCSCSPGKPNCLCGDRPRTAADQCCPTDCSFAEQKPETKNQRSTEREEQTRVAGQNKQSHRGACEGGHTVKKHGGYAVTVGTKSMHQTADYSLVTVVKRTDSKLSKRCD